MKKNDDERSVFKLPKNWGSLALGPYRFPDAAGTGSLRPGDLRRLCLLSRRSFDLLPNWHIRAIAYQLERVALDQCKWLNITMPPRSLKSVTTSVAFPAWILGRDPSKKLACVSYSQPLAVKHANDFRNVVDSLIAPGWIQ